MASLKLFNKYKFGAACMDQENCDVLDFLQRKIISSPEEVIFHLQCAIAAFYNENSLRYLPNPQLYFSDITQQEVEQFLHCFWPDVDSIVQELSDLARSVKDDFWMRYFTKCKEVHHLTFSKLLHFTLLSCDLVLTNYSHKFAPGNQVFIVQCCSQKEMLFNAKPGPVTYLMHRTTPQCLYSICRNGIRSMSLEEGGFRTTGAQHGDGIYLSDPGVHHIGGNSTLCFAVKNAERYKVADRSMYVVSADQICLRAMMVSNPSSNSNDLAIIECVQQHVRPTASEIVCV